MAQPGQVRVGAFVFVGIAVAAVIVFIIGDNRMAFDSKVDFYTHFADVQGLQSGSTIRMGGVDVGTVTQVRFLDDPDERRIRVRLSVVAREAARVRRDSVVSVAGKGLLGDKMVVLSAGSVGAPAAQPGDELSARETEDLAEMMGRLDSISAKAEGLVGNLELATAPLADPELQRSLRSSIDALGVLLAQLSSGPGYAARLVNSEAEAERLSALIDGTAGSARELQRLLRGTSRLVERVSAGPGLAHEALYGEGGAEALQQAGAAAEELALTLRGVREGNGLARALLFGTGEAGLGPNGAPASGAPAGQATALEDLTASARSLRNILANAEAGKGTLGALLVDPSVYEDMKLLLGNLQRNQVLRALVRFAIARDEAEPVEVTDP